MSVMGAEALAAGMSGLKGHRSVGGCRASVYNAMPVEGAKALADIRQKEDDEAQRIKEEGIPAQPPVPSLSMKEVKQRCAAARQDLATIQSRAQLRERDDKGNTRYLGEQEKQQRIKAAKQRIREYCY